LSFQYTLFGQTFRSNLPLPGLSPTSTSNNCGGIELHLGASEHPAPKSSAGTEELIYESSESNAFGEPMLRIFKVAHGELVQLVYDDATEFRLDRECENVWATWPAISSLENTASYLLGPVLGLMLRLRGVVCLHASAAAFGDQCVAFAGPPGAGKSTTAAAFAREGCGILSDDIVALSESAGGFEVVPGYPHLRLWPESCEMLYGSIPALPRIAPQEEKRFLPLGSYGTRFESRSLPLRAIYLLGERRFDHAPIVEALRPQAALLSLVADTFANKVLNREMRAHEFEVLGRLVSNVPVRKVFAHSDGTRIHELCRVIRNDVAFLRESSEADI
jgi:hypothetical protein